MHWYNGSIHGTKTVILDWRWFVHLSLTSDFLGFLAQSPMPDHIIELPDNFTAVSSLTDLQTLGFGMQQ